VNKLKIQWIKTIESNKALSPKGFGGLVAVILMVSVLSSYVMEIHGNEGLVSAEQTIVDFVVTVETASTQQLGYNEEILYDEVVNILERRFVQGNAWFFLSPGDEYPVERIDNQQINIIERDGEWLKIYTEQGTRWTNLSIAPQTEHLDELLSQFGYLMAVHFENMETGFTHQHNPELIFTSASVTKASYALYLFKQAEKGLIDLNSPPFPGGTTTIRELIRKNISESCDNSTMTLVNLFGVHGYTELVGQLGGNTGFVGYRVMNSSLTAHEAGIFARAIFEYIESDGRYSQLLREDLLNNQYPFIVSNYPVASKTGWFPPHAWHDMAIIYTPSPFTLVILSSRFGWTEQDYADFYKVSTAFQEFNNKWFFLQNN
jgi:hypothetical protein